MEDTASHWPTTRRQSCSEQFHCPLSCPLSRGAAPLHQQWGHGPTRNGHHGPGTGDRGWAGNMHPIAMASCPFLSCLLLSFLSLSRLPIWCLSHRGPHSTPVNTRRIIQRNLRSTRTSLPTTPIVPYGPWIQCTLSIGFGWRGWKGNG